MRYRGNKTMRFREGICINCKHELQIDTNKTTSTCPFCGIHYDVIKTIDSKERLLEEKKYDELKFKESENEGIKTEEVKESAAILKWIFAAIIAILIGGYTIMALYPKQADNSTENPTNIVESTISESIAEKVNTDDKDKKEMEVIEPIDNKLGENPTVSNIVDNKMLLLGKILQILKFTIFINFVIGMIRIIIGIINEDIEGISGAIRFLILSASMLLFISVIVPLIK